MSAPVREERPAWLRVRLRVTPEFEQVSEIARRTEAGAGESLRATRELAALSQKLQASVNQFQLR